MAGLTLTLDDLSAIAVAEGDLPRAARLRGAAREPRRRDGREPGGPSSRTSFEQRASDRASGRSMSAEDLERYGAEGAAMTLDEAVAYALEGAGTATDAGCRRCPLSRSRSLAPAPVRILDGDETAAPDIDGRPGDPDPDLRQLRGGDGRAQVQAHLPLRLLPVLLGLLLSSRTAGRAASARAGPAGRSARLAFR